MVCRFSRDSGRGSCAASDMTDPTTSAEPGDGGTIEGEVLSSDESPPAPDTPEESSRALAAIEDIIDIEKRRVEIQEERGKLAS